MDAVPPCSHCDVAIPDAYLKCRLDGMEYGFRVPRVRFFGLIPFGIQVLPKIAFAVRQSYGHHRQFKIGRGPQHISRQDSQPPAIGRDRRVQRDLHGKIRYFVR
jgi:hypothetical protein